MQMSGFSKVEWNQGGTQVKSYASQVADPWHTPARSCAQVVPRGVGTAQTLVPHAAVMKQSGVVHGMASTMAQGVGSVAVGMQICTQQISPMTTGAPGTSTVCTVATSVWMFRQKAAA